MATKKVCDGCSKESPDERGLYTANHWVSIHLERPFRLGYGTKRGSLLVCNDCFAVLKASFEGLGQMTHEAKVTLMGKA